MALVASFSGIRGIYDKDLTEGIAAKYAYSYLSFLKDKRGKSSPTIVVGMDTRQSGARLKDAVIRILDCSFIDVGIAPTPAVEFAVRHFNADGGIVITASHNEPYWNGFKFLGSDGAVLADKEMGIVINGYRHLKNFHKIQDRRLSEKNAEAIKSYSEFILNMAGRQNIKRIADSSQKIVLDPNGGTGIIAKKLLESVGVNVKGVNMEYGEFNRAVEPNEGSLVYLKNIIDESNAGFAAGFDCDADRVEILMSDGRLLSGNYLLALIVDDILSGLPNPRNKIVVVSDATSGVVKDTAQKFGAKIIEVEVGETNVIEMMKRLNAVAGGEGSSGGVIMPPSRCRDGILTLLMVLSIVAKKGKKLEGIVDGFPKYFTLRRKIEFNAAKHDNIKRHLKAHYSGEGFEIKETVGIKGGLKAIKGNSFVWFRASKTEAGIFRIISDSCYKKEAEQLIEEAVKVFDKANE